MCTLINGMPVLMDSSEDVCPAAGPGAVWAGRQGARAGHGSPASEDVCAYGKLIGTCTCAMSCTTTGTSTDRRSAALSS